MLNSYDLGFGICDCGLNLSRNKSKIRNHQSQIEKAVRLFNLTAFTCKIGHALCFHRIKNPNSRKLKTVDFYNVRRQRLVPPLHRSLRNLLFSHKFHPFCFARSEFLYYTFHQKSVKKKFSLTAVRFRKWRTYRFDWRRKSALCRLWKIPGRFPGLSCASGEKVPRHRRSSRKFPRFRPRR
jgi:hypothetical protein